jgi:D-aminopeptidase
MSGMERGDVPREWIGQMVRVRIKTRRGGEYLVLARLAEVNDDGIQLFGGDASATEAGRLEITKAYPWASLVDVRPSKIG